MKTTFTRITTGLLLAGLFASQALAAEKIVIAHRGASGYLPEHTLPAKAMAYAQGADYLEQDLVMTKDDQLVVLHDHYLDRVTDVAERFPQRARKDGRFYAIDFTLDEIRSLKFTEGFDVENGKKVQLFPGRFPMGKSEFRIHTFAEEIEFVQGLNHSTGKNIGIYPEIKAPWFHHQEGKDIAAKTLEVLKKYGYTSKKDKVYLQCFDADELKRIKHELEPKMGMDLNLVQLIAYTKWHETQQKQPDGKWVNYNYDWMLQPGAMQQIAQYADGIGPDYHMLVADGSTPGNVKLTQMVKEAHEHHLQVHPFTVRADQLPPYASDVNQLYEVLYRQADVDGLFTDFPDKAVQFLKDKRQ
ncbi:glycerophosphodiester phosphodiesterase [Kosakonia radicincitans DSM 16656]|uniref:glycerophosphodiester phosphodiesterase n=1 Tax=Kosakonia radicincitans TaxID=283686 RepID=A0AAX2EVR2_9ENTR|nr:MULTISPECIES: glycerophosphodiester phosphodiesterase [Kosakonia]MDP9568139.1 glycerophosphoryl diester phosphodiesterase [Kosakonia oryzae]APG18951.1 glycerophosphodiester phosphodiesterase [Kosakonia radicincitans]ARD59915.1 glycerophosphodiester phosphodiesterase [Kosakonia radicincitans DSM 16656]KDE34683.1 glycerophosphodiester phosphodiesterase [Kosakonia radicincitans UMEnt01/12]MDD7994956.1 glycerophosphodiester phosphodiesterase [Kosakonia radicincitans]